jgi:hypothetical protein
MFIDDLPMWGSLGSVEGEDTIRFAHLKQFEGARSVMLFTHLSFHIGVNGDQVGGGGGLCHA